MGTWAQEQAAKIRKADKARADLRLPPTWREEQASKIDQAANLRQHLPGGTPRSPAPTPEPAPTHIPPPEPTPAEVEEQKLREVLGKVEGLGQCDTSNIALKENPFAPDPPAPEPRSWAECKEKFNLNMED